MAQKIHILKDPMSGKEIQLRAVLPGWLKLATEDGVEIVVPLRETAYLMPELEKDLQSMRDTS